MKRVLSIDLETYSEQDIFSVGAYRYADDPSFEILMIAWAFDNQPVQIADLKCEEPFPDEVLFALHNADIIKSAFNANFERICLSKHLNAPMPPEQWQCTSVHSLELGLPAGLANVAKALKLPEDAQKSKTGKALINYFSKPCKPTKTNGGRTRNLPEHDPEKWQLFLDYCVQDVVTEREVRRMLSSAPLPQSEWDMWYIDQQINDYGIKIDRELANKAVELNNMHTDLLMEEAQQLTQLINPNSLPQLKKWLSEQTGQEVTSLTKDDVPKLIAATDNPAVEKVLNIRQQLGKTSVSKYEAMTRCICQDDRARGLIQFYGASRTGRWAGRLIQVQNLPQNKFKDLELARGFIKAGEFAGLKLLFSDVPKTLSQLIRTAFIADKGNTFYIADFSAIEARVIAWLAKETWRMDVFNTHGKIYEASAAQMFGVPLETIAKGGENYALRAKGKVAELALGYGGSVGALESMGALEKGLAKEELKPLVDTWRAANPMITKLWWDVDKAAVTCTKTFQTQSTHGLTFRMSNGILFIDLPSGRSLAYFEPGVAPGKFSKEQLVYSGTQDGRWTRIKSYGPKLVENIIQALSRDCLCYALKNLAAEGFRTVMHVHDEAIVEAPDTNQEETLKRIEDIMGRVPEWAEGLPLNADGYISTFYKKDDD